MQESGLGMIVSIYVDVVSFMLMLIVTLAIILYHSSYLKL